MKIRHRPLKLSQHESAAQQSAWTNPSSEKSSPKQALTTQKQSKPFNLLSVQTTAISQSRDFRGPYKFTLHIEDLSPVRSEHDISPLRRKAQSQRNLASQRALISSRRAGLTETNLDSKSEFFFHLQKIKNSYALAFKSADSNEAINQLVELLISYAQQDDVTKFLNIYMLIGETYLAQDQPAYSIQVFLQILQLCDLLHGIKDVVSKIKPKALMQLSLIAQKLCNYDPAYKLLKKTLQYAWFFHDQNLELQCFDRLGKVAYLNANLMKAIYYHNRAQWGRLESTSSINYSMAISNLKWHFHHLPTHIKGIDGQLVSRATFLPFYFGVIEDNDPTTMPSNEPCKNKLQLQRQPHRFHTLLSPEQLFEQLMNTEEFIYEMPTPREEFQEKKKDDNNEEQIPNKQSLNPMETFYYALKKNADRSEQVYLDNLKSRMKKFQGFVPPQKRFVQKCKDTYKLEQVLKKQPLQALVDERVKRFQEGPKFDDLYKVENAN